MTKTAVILFNLGGPDRLESVRPFLFNLFKDPAIIGAPAAIRYPLAALISWRRAPIARGIYEKMGGGSPLLGQTESQARALEQALSEDGVFKVFICMRYWHPMSDQVAAEVGAFGPDRIVLLPLYPQFSTTTSGSSFTDWHRAAAARSLNVPTRHVCCYPMAEQWITALADRIAPVLDESIRQTGMRPRLLLSAHGLPKKIVDGGDPYAWQVENTAAALIAALGEKNLDAVICYQSRVGPLEWIGPSTDTEVERAGRDGVPVVMVPIAFVSEHSETLVELDEEYAHLAAQHGVPRYDRVATVQDHPAFIAQLKQLVMSALESDQPMMASGGSRICPADRQRCPCGEISS